MSKFRMRSHMNNNDIQNISKGLPNFSEFNNNINILIKGIDKYKLNLKTTVNVIEVNIKEMEEYKNNLMLQKDKLENIEKEVENINNKTIIKKDKLENIEKELENINNKTIIKNDKVENTKTKKYMDKNMYDNNHGDYDVDEGEDYEFNINTLEEQVKNIMSKFNIQHSDLKDSGINNDVTENKKTHKSLYPIENFNLDKDLILPIIKNDINNKI